MNKRFLTIMILVFLAISVIIPAFSQKSFCRQNITPRIIGNELSEKNMENEKYSEMSFSVSSSTGDQTAGIYNGTLVSEWILGPAKSVNKLVMTADGYILVGADFGIIMLSKQGDYKWGILTLSNVTSISYGDINGDLSDEILTGCEDGLFLITNISGYIISSNYLGERIIYVSILEIDGDISKEYIVILANATILALDYMDGLLWKYFVGDEIVDTAICDIDNDGRDEVIIGTQSGYIFAIKNGELLWSFFAGNTIGSLLGKDVNGDTIPEILFGTLDGYLYNLTNTGKLYKKIYLGKPIISLLIDDLNSDGKIEIAAGTQTGHVFLLATNGTIIYTTFLGEEILGIKSANLTADNFLEIVIRGNASIFGLNYSLYQLWQYSAVAEDYLAEDIDNDLQSEVILGETDNYLEVLENDSNLKSTYTISLDAFNHIVDDADDDGLSEYIIINEYGEIDVIKHNKTIVAKENISEVINYCLGSDIDDNRIMNVILGLNNGSLVVYEYPLNLQWTIDLGSPINHIIVDDINDDGKRELIVSTVSGSFIVNASGSIIKNYLSGYNVTVCSIGDSDSDGTKEMHFGTSDGYLYVLNYSSASPEWSLNMGPSGVRVISISDINIAIGLSNGTILLVNGTTREFIWKQMLSGEIIKIMYDEHHGNIFLIAISEYEVGILDYSTGNFLAKRAFLRIISADLNDFNGDLRRDIALIDAYEGLIIVNSGLKVLWRVELPEIRYGRINAYDVDNDVVSELVISTSLGTVIIDATPEIWIIEPQDNSWHSTNRVNITWSMCGVIPYRFEIYLNDQLIDTIYTAWTRNYTIEIPSDGSWAITVKVQPKAGHPRQASVIAHVDTLAPFLNIIQPENDTFTSNRNITLIWEGNDEGSGIDHYEVRLDLGEWLSVGLANSYEFTNLNYGEHILEVAAYDVAGNVNISSIRVIVDFKAPEIYIIEPLNNSFVNKSSFNVTWDYAEDYLDYFEIRIDNGTPINVGMNTSYELYNLSDGKHVIEITGYDKAENKERVIIEFTIDTQSPQLCLLSPKNNSYINTTTITIKWNALDDHLDKVKIWINETLLNETDEASGEIEITLNDGYYIIRAMVIDEARNANESLIVLYIDTLKPVVVLSSPTNNTWINNSTIEIKWSASDTLSGISYYELRINEGAWIKIFTTYFSVKLNDGSHEIIIRAYDRAGNYAEVRSLINIDTKAPRVNIKSPINGTHLNITDLRVEWECTDRNLDIVLIVLDSKVIATLPDYISSYYIINDISEGMHNVTIICLDKAGNVGTHAVIFVIDRTPPTIVITNIENNTVLENETLKIEWIIIDELSPIKAVYVRIDGEEWRFVDHSFYEVDLTKLSIGDHYFTIKAIDKASNHAQVTLHFIIKEKEIPSKPPSYIPHIIGLALITLIVGIIDLWIYYKKKQIKLVVEGQEEKVESNSKNITS